MDWEDEASAIIDDIKNYVNKIELSTRHKSSDTRIYFEIVTLEGVTLVVSMDADGFIICDSVSGGRKLEAEGNDDTLQDEPPIKIYETINALLDHNSPKYREAFASDLHNRMRSLE